MDPLQQDKKEQRVLKQRIELLERENHALKKSLFELSTRYNASRVQPFALSELLEQSLDHVTPLFDSKTESEDSTRFVRDKTNNRFYQKHELKGHGGAVYDVKFSPCGRWLASGSFDKTVRIWDWTTQKELHCLLGHGLNISDLSWSEDSIELLSGGFDQTCKIWDTEQGKNLETFEMDGFVQCVQFSPIDRSIFFAGTSRNVLMIMDRRQPGNCMTLRNDSMVNTISVYKYGTHIVSGDASGYIKTWDVRTGKCIHSYLNEPTKKPISYISSCETGDENARFFAVNSYDNVLRIYDRGIGSTLVNYNTIHALKGYKNKNWPIKSSFFKLRDHMSGGIRGLSSDDLFSKPELMTESRDSSMYSKNLPSSERDKPNDVYSLIATGSADPYLYVYSLGSTEGTSELVQRLEGHTDRVYGCHFHPNEMLLASGSADFTIKIWTINSRKRTK